MERTLKPLSRRKAEGTKFDFRLQFQASRVPITGWDKLVISLLSIETGRITVKTSRGVVRNGSCQWQDPVVESTKLFQNPSTGEYDEKLYKLFVQMGSLRAGILGEATLNLSEYVTAESPETVALPLRNCSGGTVLHVKIQCLTPRFGFRELEGQRSGSVDQDYPGSVYEDNSSNSDVSENLTTGSAGSSTNQNFTPLLYSQTSQGHHRDRPLPKASAYNSFDTRESDPYGNEVSNGMVKGFSNIDGPSAELGYYSSHWPNAGASGDSSNNQEGSRPVQVKYQPNQSSPHNWQTERLNPNLGLENGARIAFGLPQKLEAAEATIQELREETLKWERQARRLSVDVETFRQQLAVELKNGAELKMRMSATEAERDCLKAEIEQVKALKLAPKVWAADNYSMWGREDFMKSLQEEVKYEKQVSANLQVLLRKTQGSNVDLLSALEELGENLEASNKVVDKLTEANKKLEAEVSKAQSTGDFLRSSNDVDMEWMQRLNVAEAKLADREEKIKWLMCQGGFDLENGDPVVSHELWNEMVSAHLMEKDEQIKELELKLRHLETRAMEAQVIIDGLDDLSKTAEMLEDQDRDSKEVTDENMKLFLKLSSAIGDPSWKVGKKQLLDSGASRLSTDSHTTTAQACVAALEVQIDTLGRKRMNLDDRVYVLEGEKRELLQKTEQQDVILKQYVAELTSLSEDLKLKSRLEMEVVERRAEVDKLALIVAECETSIGNLELSLFEAEHERVLLDAKFQELMEETRITVSRITVEKAGLLEKLDEAYHESRRKSERLDQLVEQMEVLKTAFDSHSLEEKTSKVDLLAMKQDLEARILALKELNMVFSAKVSGLEMELKNACKEQDTYRHDLQVASAENVDLKTEIIRLQSHQSFLEQQLQMANSECTRRQEKIVALEVEIMVRQKEGDHKEHLLQVELDYLLGCKESHERHAQKAEQAFLAAQEKAASLDYLLTELEQLSATVDEKENLASKAIAEVSELCAEKMKLENSLKLMHDKVKKFEELQTALEDNAEDVSRELGASRLLCSGLTQKLEETKSTLRQHLMNQEDERKDYQRNLGLLEEELLQKTDQFSRIEQKLMLLEPVRGENRSNESGDNNNLKDVEELQEKLRSLQDDANASREQLAVCRREFNQKEAELMAKIESLELSNEQLAAGVIDSGAEQLKNELIRLQNHNSFLSRKEQELLSRMHTQEVLQEEVKRLQESNDLLEARLSKFVETAKNPFLLEKIVNLETELAEAVEANNMYKLQLKSVFDKQQNLSSTAAHHEFNDFDEVIEDLFQYKKKATQLEAELHSLHERYSLISLQLAEAEAERGELMMTVKNLKAVKRS